MKPLALVGNRIVQGMWIGERLSTMEQLSLRSFLAHGHEYHLYVYEHVRDVPAGVVIRDAREILPAKRIFRNDTYTTYASFSDLFRYELLLSRGGWWLDTDLVCLKPFDFDSEYVFSSERRPNGTELANTGVIKAPPGSELMTQAVAFCESTNIAAGEWGIGGPQLMQKLAPQLGLQPYVRSAATFCPIHFYDWATVLDPARSWHFAPESYTVHFWHELWRRSGRMKDAIYEKNCLFEQLKRRYGLTPRSYSLPYRLTTGKIQIREELKKYSIARKAVALYRGLSAGRSGASPTAGAERL